VSVCESAAAAAAAGKQQEQRAAAGEMVPASYQREVGGVQGHWCRAIGELRPPQGKRDSVAQSN
jgi:hypothetical protein